MMSFRVEDYEFTFTQARLGVNFFVKRISRDITEEEADKVKEWVGAYLKDMGKWETAIWGISNLLHDAIGMQIPKPPVKEELERHYRLAIMPKLSENILTGQIDLTPEEREHRRWIQKLQLGEDVQLPVDEIIEQAKNVLKWRSVSIFLSWLPISRLGVFTGSTTGLGR